jgi:hypothetical protein
MIIIVPLVLTKYRGGVPLIDAQEAVEELAADCSDEALGDCVRSRCADRRFDDPDVGRGEHGVEGRVELGVSTTTEALTA